MGSIFACVHPAQTRLQPWKLPSTTFSLAPELRLPRSSRPTHPFSASFLSRVPILLYHFLPRFSLPLFLSFSVPPSFSLPHPILLRRYTVSANRDPPLRAAADVSVLCCVHVRVFPARDRCRCCSCCLLASFTSPRYRINIALHNPAAVFRRVSIRYLIAPATGDPRMCAIPLSGNSQNYLSTRFPRYRSVAAFDEFFYTAEYSPQKYTMFELSNRDFW